MIAAGGMWSSACTQPLSIIAVSHCEGYADPIVDGVKFGNKIEVTGVDGERKRCALVGGGGGALKGRERSNRSSSPALLPRPPHGHTVMMPLSGEGATRLTQRQLIIFLQ